MSTLDLSTAQWFKSSRSSNNGDCVECADGGAHIVVRDSKDPTGPVLFFAPGPWSAFLTGIRAGQFAHHA